MRKLKSNIGKMIRKLLNYKYQLMGIKIGNNCFISTGAWLDDRRGKIIIGNNVSITRGAKILSHDQTTIRLKKKILTEVITQLDNSVFIGMNAIVLAGIHIHENSIIGAGCVVTKNIPPNCVVVGNPMRIIKKYNMATEKWESVEKHNKNV
jgi:acetyltransferase-like isoleucine patch superfamily enzyme